MNNTNKSEYGFDRAYAYCLCMKAMYDDNTKDDCGFKTMCLTDEILILDEQEDIKIWRGDLSSLEGVEEVKTLINKAEDMFAANRGSLLTDEQMSSLTSFIDSVEKAWSTHTTKENCIVTVYNRNIVNTIFWIYQADDGGVTVVKIINSVDGKAKYRYFAILNNHKQAYAINTDVEEALSLCDSSLISCKEKD